MIRLSGVLRAGVAALAFTALAGSAGAADYPDRPITIIAPYPAGGGTDMVSRSLAAVLQEELGVPVNVVNRGGGAGVPGSQAIARAEPDGYTIGLVASDVSLYQPQGLSDLTYEDYTAIGQTNALASGVTVRADSEYETMADLVAAIEANPGELKGTGAAPGVNWHVAFVGLMLDLGLDPKSVIWVPTQGGTAGQLDVAAGNSTFATASLAEARALVEAGELRPLAVMTDERLKTFPEVPTLGEAIDSDWTFALWHGLVGPKGLPEEVTSVLVPAVEKAVQDPAFRKPLEDRGFTLVWRGPEQFRQHMAQDLEKMREVLGALEQ